MSYVIHGGAVKSVTARADVPCNAYCRPEKFIHCDLMYPERGTSRERVFQFAEMVMGRSATIMNVERTTEAPLPDPRIYMPMHDSDNPLQPEETEAWLIFWRVQDTRR